MAAGRIRIHSDDNVDNFFSYSSVCDLHVSGDATLDDFRPLVGRDQVALLPFDENGETEDMIAHIRIVGFASGCVAFVIVNFNDEIMESEGVRTMTPNDLVTAITES